MNQAHEKWKDIIDYVKAHNTVTQDDCKIWLESLHPFGCDEYKISALYDTDEEWPLQYIEERFGTMIEEAAELVLGRKLCFKVYSLPKPMPMSDLNIESWMPFTSKLRRIMTDNPDLPVVIKEFYSNGWDCKVNDLYDGTTNTFLMRRILVYKGQPE